MRAEDKPKPSEITARTAARIAAVQALYQMDMAGTDLNDVIAEFLSERLSGENRDEMLAGADRVFFADILRAVVRRQREIDPHAVVGVDVEERGVAAGTGRVPLAVSEIFERADGHARLGHAAPGVRA